MGVKNIEFEQISKNEVVVGCARCNQTGRVWPVLESSEPCWICNGKGLLLIQVDRLPLYSCIRCNGSGRVWPILDDSEECSTCKGTGCIPVAGLFKIIK